MSGWGVKRMRVRVSECESRRRRRGRRSAGVLLDNHCLQRPPKQQIDESLVLVDIILQQRCGVHLRHRACRRRRRMPLLRNDAGGAHFTHCMLTACLTDTACPCLCESAMNCRKLAHIKRRRADQVSFAKGHQKIKIGVTVI